MADCTKKVQGKQFHFVEIDLLILVSVEGGNLHRASMIFVHFSKSGIMVDRTTFSTKQLFLGSKFQVG